MTDIVTRLRGFDHDYHVPPSLLLEAAAEIERLRAEAERVQSAVALVNGWDTGTDATEQP